MKRKGQAREFRARFLGLAEVTRRFFRKERESV